VTCSHVGADLDPRSDACVQGAEGALGAVYADFCLETSDPVDWNPLPGNIEEPARQKFPTLRFENGANLERRILSRRWCPDHFSGVALWHLFPQ
jgi:hypothetical protein